MILYWFDFLRPWVILQHYPKAHQNYFNLIYIGRIAYKIRLLTKKKKNRLTAGLKWYAFLTELKKGSYQFIYTFFFQRYFLVSTIVLHQNYTTGLTTIVLLLFIFSVQM